jgi:hypothetical protein
MSGWARSRVGRVMTGASEGDRVISWKEVIRVTEMTNLLA